MTAWRLAAVAVVVLVSVLLAAGCGNSSDEPSNVAPGSAEPAGDGLADLTSVDQFRAAFNADRGTPRLLLLLSPT